MAGPGLIATKECLSEPQIVPGMVPLQLSCYCETGRMRGKHAAKESLPAGGQRVKSTNGFTRCEQGWL